MLIFLDTETTGTEVEDRLCQIAYTTELGDVVNEMFRPCLPVSIDAMCVHHITNKMLADKPTFVGSAHHQKLSDLVADPANVLVIHNAKFDVEMLNKEGIYPKRVICTLKLARHLDPDGKLLKHNLQYLRYSLGLEVDADAHDALGDVLVLEQVFERMFNKMCETMAPKAILTKMEDVSSKNSLLARIYFGKHKDEFFKNIPVSYLQWLNRQDELNEDVAFTVQHHLNQKLLGA